MDYLAATYYFDYESKEIQQLIAACNVAAGTKKEKAIQLYLKVRDA